MAVFVVTYRGTVYPWYCDHMGHLNVMWYNRNFDEACRQLFAMVGLTREQFEQDRAGMAAVEQHTQFQSQLHAGDIVSVHTTVLEIRDKSIRLRHELHNDETREIAAVSEMTGVYLDAAWRKACSLPEHARERIRRLFSDGQRALSIDSIGVVLEECR